MAKTISFPPKTVFVMFGTCRGAGKTSAATMLRIRMQNLQIPTTLIALGDCIRNDLARMLEFHGVTGIDPYNNELKHKEYLVRPLLNALGARVRKEDPTYQVRESLKAVHQQIEDDNFGNDAHEEDPRHVVVIPDWRGPDEPTFIKQLVPHAHVLPIFLMSNRSDPTENELAMLKTNQIISHQLLANHSTLTALDLEIKNHLVPQICNILS